MTPATETRDHRGALDRALRDPAVHTIHRPTTDTEQPDTHCTAPAHTDDAADTTRRATNHHEPEERA